MKISTYTIQPFRLPLQRPIYMMGRHLRSREGCLLTLCFDNGTVGRGEAVPFPGFHRETCLQAGEQLRAYFAQKSFPWKLPQEPLDFLTVPGISGLFPSVKYAIQMAILNGWASSANLSPAKAFSRRPLQRIPVNVLLTETELSDTNHIDKLVAEGAEVFKVKVGRRHYLREAEDLIRLSQKLPATARLRLDANRAWNLPQALSFASAIENLNIEYIEEPLHDSGLLPDFARQSELPLALDESVEDFGLASLPHFPGLAAVIIKPSVIGDLLTLVRFSEEFAPHINVVISSAFESGIGLGFATHLASAFQRPEVAAGLGTWQWLARDAIDPAFSTPGWTVSPKAWLPGDQRLSKNFEELIIA